MKHDSLSEQEVRQMLDHISDDTVPDSSPEFEKTLMDKVIQRKNELDKSAEEDDFWDGFDSDLPEENNERNPGRPVSPAFGWKALIAAAALFVFLIGGTLLTRGKLRDPGPGPAANIIGQNAGLSGSGTDGSEIQDASDKKNTASGHQESASFLQDMGLFVRASLPYLVVIAAGGTLSVIVRQKLHDRKKKKE